VPGAWIAMQFDDDATVGVAFTDHSSSFFVLLLRCDSSVFSHLALLLNILMMEYFLSFFHVVD
jgi:hypothetical protein